MISAIEECHLLPSELPKNRGLVNAFSGKKSNEQTYDLLNFRKIGNDDLMQFIKHRILRQPSTSAPVRRHKLLTMAWHGMAWHHKLKLVREMSIYKRKNMIRSLNVYASD